MKKILLTAGLVVGCIPVLLAQLAKEYNVIRGGDILIKQQVEYKLPDQAGINVTWDFSQLQAINNSYNVIYSQAPLINDSVYIMGYNEFSKKDIALKDLIIATEHNTMYYYQLKGDSLLLLGHENPTVKLQYKEPYVTAIYPINYGQRTYSNYSAQGLYSGTEPIRTKGQIETIADSFGKIILPTGDTLNPVLRVKISQSIFDNEEDNHTNGMLNKGNLLETYRWYTKGYRYPIFETIRNINLADSSTIFATAFFFPPQNHYYLDTDTENQKILDEMWNIANKKDVDKKQIDISPNIKDYISYAIHPNPVNTTLIINYTIKEDIGVAFQLFSFDGSLAKQVITDNLSIGDYSQSINCTNLMSGNYVLRITVNNMFVNEKIIKR